MFSMRITIFIFFVLTMLFSACQAPRPKAEGFKDAHSFSNTDSVRIRHMDLNLNLDFEQHTLSGVVTLKIDNLKKARTLVLDTRDLEIFKVEAQGDNPGRTYTLGSVATDYMGAPLTIRLQPGDSVISVAYKTSPNAAALQWLNPEQTAGKKYPFLFSQSQAILARTWVPCQDTPGVRFTYSATIQAPKELLVLMSASNPKEKNKTGIYHFEMEQPIPSYLLALAAGDLRFRAFDGRSGVYAEPEMIDKAAYEFADTPNMIQTAEKLYGPYRWGRYDILVLPPSFPFGGMENPRLTFATPTVITGDRSLVSLIAHELAHSWSGNLVTNATWNDIWLNEGFTTYFELRIMEALYGREYEEMLEQIGYQDLQRTLEELGSDNPDTRLALNVDDRDPDEALSLIAYEKGRSFLKMLEIEFGRPRFDAFLKKYFDTYAFQSMDTEHFTQYLRDNLIKHRRRVEGQIHLREWIYEPGLPENCPVPDSPEFRKVDEQRMAFLKGTPAEKLDVKGWSTHHWLHFIRALPRKMTTDQMAALDTAFSLSASPNSEIAYAWFRQAIGHEYAPALPYIKRFLLHVGRAKFVVPLYTALNSHKAYRQFARDVYKKAREGYHPVAYGAVDRLLRQ